MVTKNNKRLIISGLLFIIATISYVLYQILLWLNITDFYGVESYHIAWENIIFTIIYSVILILYCFVLHKTKIERKTYLLGLVAYALLNIYFILSTDGRFDFYVMSDVLFLAITVFMIIEKIKINKGTYISGTIMFIIYALTQFIAVVNDFLSGFRIGGIVWLFFCVYLIAEFIAFLNLWISECGNLISTKKQTTLTKTPLENDLMFLKQLLDNGTISEDEYNRKKSEILNKF